ncbi:hypothetical protein FACS1894208_11650 [Clostridia bacterium]|nr:hypothetical protein FACS1894208_11650 [Clostridia bacterium]
MKKAVIICYLLSVICYLLSGCAGMLENEYEFVAPHADTSPESVSDSGGLRAANYSELKNAILRLTRSGAASGVIRLHNYSGNADDDTQTACRSVLIEEPIGAYALDFINYEIVPLLVDYDVNLSLLRRRTAGELRSIKSVSGPSEFRERFDALLTDYGTQMTVETNFYQETSYDLSAMLSDLYDSRPIAAQGRPAVSGALYPEKGLRRVIELTLSYPGTTSVMLTRRDRCQKEVEDLSLPDGDYAPLNALTLYDMLAARCEFDTELYAEYRAAAAEGREIQSTTYDALVCAARRCPRGTRWRTRRFVITPG